MRMRFSTGALKAAGSLGLALYAMSFAGLSTGALAAGGGGAGAGHERLQPARPASGTLDQGVRPARRRATLAAGSLRALWTLGLFAGPALVAGAYDLRERAMLGDTGANLLGALAGLWLVLTLSAVGQAVALGLLAAVYALRRAAVDLELVERMPLLRELDSWGRPSDEHAPP